MLGKKVQKKGKQRNEINFHNLKINFNRINKNEINITLFSNYI